MHQKKKRKSHILEIIILRSDITKRKHALKAKQKESDKKRSY